MMSIWYASLMLTVRGAVSLAGPHAGADAGAPAQPLPTRLLSEVHRTTVHAQRYRLPIDYSTVLFTLFLLLHFLQSARYFCYKLCKWYNNNLFELDNSDNSDKYSYTLNYCIRVQ